MSIGRNIVWGDVPVPVIERDWPSLDKSPYRRTYDLKPGQHWKDMAVTEKQWERYAVVDGEAIPVGAVICRELMAEGAVCAAFVEIFPTCVLVGPDLVCLAKDVRLGQIIDEVVTANGGRMRGFPDVIAIFPEDRIVMREAKNIGAKDKLGPFQHEMARILRRLYGAKLELAVVKWGAKAARKSDRVH